MSQVHGTSYTMFYCFLAGKGVFCLGWKTADGESGREHCSDAEVPTRLRDPLGNPATYRRKATGGFSVLLSSLSLGCLGARCAAADRVGSHSQFMRWLSSSFRLSPSLHDA